MPVSITVHGRLELRRGAELISRHNVVEEAIERAINAGAGDYRIIYPERSVKVYGTINPDSGDTVAPTVPTSLTLVSKGATSATLSWAASTDAYGVSGYQIFRNGSAIDTTANTSYTSSGLSPSTQYTFTVAAYDAAGNNSGTSGQTPLVVTTDANASPVWSVGEQALTTNQAYSLSLASVCSDADSGTLTFSVVSGTLPTGVTFNAGAGTVSGTPTAVGSSSVTFRATDGIVNVDQAIAFNVLNADATAPSVPANLAVAVASSSQLNLSWDASSDTAGTNERATGVASYRVYRSTDGSNYSLRTTVTAPTVTYSDTGLSASTLYYYKVDAVDGAGNASAQSAAQSATTSSAGAMPAVYALELVSPRASGSSPISGFAAMPSGHRIFKAYPGIEYNIRAVVIGGSYPYSFSLTNAPAGMSINAQTGEITWPNPQIADSGTTPSITVTDAEGNSQSSSWGITVTTSGFLFYDAVSGLDANAGTLASPRRTLGHARANTANQIVYFRSGTYTMSNFTALGYTASYGTGHLKCGWGPVRGSSVQMLAYPGESVTFDHAYAAGSYAGVMLELEPATYSASAQPMYLDGITFANVDNCLLRPTASGSYHHIRRCTFTQIWAPLGGDNPAGIMWTAASIGGPYKYYVALQDNVGTDLDNGQTCGMYKLYTFSKLLIEDDDAYACGSPFDIKQDCPRFEVRGGWYRDNVYQQPGIVGNQHANCSGEIRYNRVTSRASSAGVNDGPALALNNFSDTARVDVYRNTLVGKVWIEGTTGVGPFRFYRNVIINNNTTYADRLSYTNYSGTSGLVQLGTGADTNLVGSIGSSIVNESGGLELTGSYTQYVGQKGYQL